MGIGGLSDRELVARCRSGDDEAWGVFVDRFSRYVYAILARGFELNNADAEDVFQDVFSRSFDQLDRLRDDDAVRAWLAQITRRLAIDRIRAGGREVPVEELPEQVESDFFDRLDEAMDVRGSLEDMPENCREILDRFFVQDQTYAKIGEELDLPGGTIASRISRCLVKLREQLEAAENEPGGRGR